MLKLLVFSLLASSVAVGLGSIESKATLPHQRHRGLAERKGKDGAVIDELMKTNFQLVRQYGGKRAGRTRSEMVTKAKKFMQTYGSKHGLVGFAVGVVQDDALVLAEGYGLAAKDDPTRKLDANTIIQIGSVTKTFVALALGILVDEGKIEWTDKVKDHLPWLELYDANAAKKMTIADVLTMMTGFGVDQGDIAVDAGIVGNTERKVIENIKYLEPEKSLRSKYMYNNLNYVLAGQVVEGVTGKSWDTFIKERILQPLKMNRSFRSSIDAKPLSNVAHGHIMCGNKIHGPYDVVDSLKMNVGGIDDLMDAAGSMVSTLNDMGQFMRVVLNWGSLDDATAIVKDKDIVKDMATEHATVGWDVEQLLAGYHIPEKVNKNKAVSAGYGFDAIGRLFWGERYFDKAGDTTGQCTRTGFLPVQKIAVLVQALHTPLEFGTQFDHMHADWIRTYIAGIFLDIPAAGLDAWLAATQNATKALVDLDTSQLPALKCGAEFYEGSFKEYKNAKKMVGVYEAESSDEFYGNFTIRVNSTRALSVQYGHYSGDLLFVDKDDDDNLVFMRREPNDGARDLFTFTIKKGKYVAEYAEMKYEQQ